MRAQSVLERHEQQQPATAAGALVVLCAVGAAASAAVPGRNQVLDGSVWYGWNYQAAFWPLTICLAGAGLTMAARPRHARRAATVAAVLGAQATGHGLVAVRDWFNVNGASSMASHNLATVVTFAAAVAVFGTVATCVGVGLVWREPAKVRPTRRAYVVAGAVVTLALPLTLGAVAGDSDITSLGQYALTYSIPWGAGLASGAWRGPGAALAAVAGSAAIVAVAGAAGQP